PRQQPSPTRGAICPTNAAHSSTFHPTIWCSGLVANFERQAVGPLVQVSRTPSLHARRSCAPLTSKTRRAPDSTVLEDAVATRDSVTLLIAAIRRVGREPQSPGQLPSPL